MRLRTSLFLVPLATAIPIAVFSLLVSGALLQQHYENFVSAVKDRNHAFLTAVGAEVIGSITTLQALASSPSRERGDLQRFHQEAKAALESQTAWLNVILHSRDGRHIVNAYLPWGTPLLEKPTQPESIAPVVQQKRPSVGSVIFGGPFIERPGIPIRVPVVRDGSVAYVLPAARTPHLCVLPSVPRAPTAVRRGRGRAGASARPGAHAGAGAARRARGGRGGGGRAPGWDW